MNEELKSKLIDKVNNYNQNNTLSKTERLRLELVIEYFCSDMTYNQLAETFECSISTIKRAVNDNIIEVVLGKNFVKLLKEKTLNKKQHAYENVERKKMNLELYVTNKEELLELSIIKNEEIERITEKEFKMLQASLLFLKYGTEKGYSFIAKKIGKSKAMISYYLNDENLKNLLKEVFYLEIKKMLKEKQPAPSRLIQEKKEKIYTILNYIENNDQTTLRSMGKELGIDIRTLSMYLNDEYFNELKEKKNKK